MNFEEVPPGAPAKPGTTDRDDDSTSAPAEAEPIGVWWLRKHGLLAANDEESVVRDLGSR